MPNKIKSIKLIKRGGIPGFTDLQTVNDFHKLFSGGGIGDKPPDINSINIRGNSIAIFINGLAEIFGLKYNIAKRSPDDAKDLEEIEDALKANKLTSEEKKYYADKAEKLEKEKLKVQKDIADGLLAEQKAELTEQKKQNRKTPTQLMKGIGTFLTKFWDVAVGYVVLAFVLLLILSATSGGSRGKKSSSGNSKNPFIALKRMAKADIRAIKSETKSIFGTIKKYLNKIYAYFSKISNGMYKLKQMSNSFSGGHNNAFDRQKAFSGRCDNLTFVETTPDGQGGHCDSTLHPLDITWRVNNNYPTEYNDLPATRQNVMNNKYNTIKIPYSVNSQTNPDGTTSVDPSFYLPQCGKAYYANTCKNSVCLKADMFEDTYTINQVNTDESGLLTCIPKNNKFPTQYPLLDGVDANTAGKSFDDINSNNNSQCINIDTLTDTACPTEHNNAQSDRH